VVPFVLFSGWPTAHSVPEGVHQSAAALVCDALEPTAAPFRGSECAAQSFHEKRPMNALLIYSEFPETYRSLKHALKFVGKRATQHPLGLMTVAALFCLASGRSGLWTPMWRDCVISIWPGPKWYW
jgi:hypothetical protein